MMASVAILAACSDDDNGSGNPGPGPAPSGVYETGLVFGEKEGSDSVYYIGNGDKHFPAPKGDYVLNASRKYKLRGWVYIEDGSTITIPAGTVIRGDKQTQAALIIERGGQIFARGTASKPIVFTSEEAPGNRRPGDWGGLILCGRASNNKGEQQIEGGPRSYHGGGSNPVDTDNSGCAELRARRVRRLPVPNRQGDQRHHVRLGRQRNDGRPPASILLERRLVRMVRRLGQLQIPGSLSRLGRRFLTPTTASRATCSFCSACAIRASRINRCRTASSRTTTPTGSDEEPYTTARFLQRDADRPDGSDAAFYNQSASTENPEPTSTRVKCSRTTARASASFRQACKSGATRASVYTIRS